MEQTTMEYMVSMDGLYVAMTIIEYATSVETYQMVDRDVYVEVFDIILYTYLSSTVHLMCT